MKHIILVGFLLAVACGVHAKPFYSYDLHGTVTGDTGGVNALADIDKGDDFVIRFNVWANNLGQHKVSFRGNIGSWAFQEQQTVAYYACCDWAPERFYTPGSSSPLNAPNGNGSTVYPNDIYLILYGMRQIEPVAIPKENRLIRDTGEINLNQFHSGGFQFWFFNQDDESGYFTEEDLFGSITRIIEVPEPGTLLLSALGLGLLVIRRGFHYRT